MTLLPDGTTAKKQLPAVTRDITQVGADPRVQQLRALLTELIKEWMDKDAAANARIAELEAAGAAPDASPEI